MNKKNYEYLFYFKALQMNKRKEKKPLFPFQLIFNPKSLSFSKTARMYPIHISSFIPESWLPNTYRATNLISFFFFCVDASRNWTPITDLPAAILVFLSWQLIAVRHSDVSHYLSNLVLNFLSRDNILEMFINTFLLLSQFVVFKTILNTIFFFPVKFRVAYIEFMFSIFYFFFYSQENCNCNFKGIFFLNFHKSVKNKSERCFFHNSGHFL